MFYTYKYTQYIFYMPYSAHDIIYTALSTLYLRALHPDCMFATKQLYNNNYFNNKDMDVPFGFGLFFYLKKKYLGSFNSVKVHNNFAHFLDEFSIDETDITTV